MSTTDFPSRDKYKNYLANDVHCELYFFAKVVIFFYNLPIFYLKNYFFLSYLLTTLLLRG